MTKRKGSFRERNKPLISLKNLSEEGTIVIPRPDYKAADPIPSSWVMIKPGDVLISHSGTIRLVLKKNWQEGEVQSLRLSTEHADGRVEASLEVEKMAIDSSNFEHLNKIMRPNFSHDISPHEFKPEYFTRAARYNILTFLGFGKIGSEIYSVMPARTEKRAPDYIALNFFLDTSSNLLFELHDGGDVHEPQEKKENWIEIEVTWTRQPEKNNYIITEFSYPPNTASIALQTITLASELANALSLTNLS